MNALRLRRLLARSALLGCFLMATIVASSAFLRLSTAGLGCSDWPHCYGQIRQASAQAPGLHPPEPTLGLRLARAAHRISAMLAGVLVLFTCAISVQPGVRSLHNIGSSAALLILTIFLAVLGRFTAGTLTPAVAVANLAGGYAMLILFWSLFLANRPSRRTEPRTAGWLHALSIFVALLAAAQVLLGGLVSAKFAPLSCFDLASCWPTSNALAVFMAALDPTAPLELDASGRVLPQAGGAAVHALHRAGALVLLPTAIALSIALAVVERRRLAASVLAFVVSAQSIAGWSLAGLQYPLQLALVHNALAAFLLASIVTALHTAPPEPAPRRGTA